MSEPWIDEIVADIKRRYAAAAAADQRAAERLALLQRKAPLLWSDLADHLRAALASLQAGLQGERTAGTMPLDFPGGRHPIRVTRSAYPALVLQATPDLTTGEVDLRLTRNGGPEIAIPCRFDLTPEREILLHLNGESYTDPAAAARWLVEWAFRAPAPSEAR